MVFDENLNFLAFFGVVFHENYDFFAFSNSQGLKRQKREKKVFFDVVVSVACYRYLEILPVRFEVQNLILCSLKVLVDLISILLNVKSIVDVRNESLVDVQKNKNFENFLKIQKLKAVCLILFNDHRETKFVLAVVNFLNQSLPVEDA